MNVAFHGETSTSKPSFVLDSDGVNMVYGLPGTTAVEVVSLTDLSAQPLQLWTESQSREISAVCLGISSLGFSDPGPGRYSSAECEETLLCGSSDPRPGHDSSAECEETLLCCASVDAVVIWSLAAAQSAILAGDPLPEPIVLMSGQGQVDAITMGGGSRGGSRGYGRREDTDLDTLLVVCAGVDVHVFALPSLQNVLRLEAHAAPVLAACFCSPHAPYQLVTAGEDRTFKRVGDQAAASVAAAQASDKSSLGPKVDGAADGDDVQAEEEMQMGN
eukprot:gene14829-20882_t